MKNLIQCYLSRVTDKVICLCHFPVLPGSGIDELNSNATTRFALKCSADQGFDQTRGPEGNSRHQTDPFAMMESTARGGRAEHGRAKSASACGDLLGDLDRRLSTTEDD